MKLYDIHYKIGRKPYKGCDLITLPALNKEHAITQFYERITKPIGKKSKPFIPKQRTIVAITLNPYWNKE